MKPPRHHIDPPAGLTVAIGLLLALILAALYLVRPEFVDHLQSRMTDAIVAAGPATTPSGGIVVVSIDEPSLAAWGQWPWPRSQMARLLDGLARRGARSIALDFIMAEPDRRSAVSPDGDDAILAACLAAGPFVLGYEFRFDGLRSGNAACPARPLDIVSVRRPSQATDTLRLYQASGIIDNTPVIREAAAQAGFLNGIADSDGRLRRLPLLIDCGGHRYPNLALAALLPTVRPQPPVLQQSPVGQCRLVLKPYTIPIDENGNLRITFGPPSARLTRIAADRVLTGRLDAAEIRGRVVLVGLEASGLAPVYRTPAGDTVSAVAVHAHAIDTMLGGNYIYRHRGVLYGEILFSLLIAGVYALCIARLEFTTNALIGAAAIAGVWGSAQLIFNGQRLLVSPLLPITVILFGGIVLMLFKYWTRQRKAREHLQDALVLIRSNEQNLDAIIKTIPDIVFRLDASGRITFISPAVTKYHKNPEALIGTHILDLVVPGDRHNASFRINERRKGARATANLEIRLKLSPEDAGDDPNGRFFSVSAEGIYHAEPPDGHAFVGTQGIARDIDERKHLERRLEQSKRMEAIGGLAAGVAHDLNNILSGLVSYPELLLLDLPADSPLRSKIETIQRSGQRAADIVQDMLMIARCGVKNQSILNLNAVVDNYLKTPEYKRLQELHDRVRIATEPAPDLMNTKGSTVHMLKMMANLVGNAAEAMPTGGTIRVSTQNRYLDTEIQRYEVIPEGEYVVLRISDDGVGIPAEALHRIFEPFYSRKQMGRSGSGLGMTVVWNTVKDHGGFIDIRSREGHGTRFDVYLPATRDTVGIDAHKAVLEDYIGSERILVVDDIPEQRDIAMRMLSKLGYQAAGCSSGEEAVAYLKTHAVDLVVLDMVMPPGIDGLETYRRILAIRPGQRAIVASGYAPSDRVDAMQALGAGEYIRKPYTLEKIGLTVRRELDRC